MSALKKYVDYDNYWHQVIFRNLNRTHMSEDMMLEDEFLEEENEVQGKKTEELDDLVATDNPFFEDIG